MLFRRGIMLMVDNCLCMPCSCWFFSSTKSLVVCCPFRKLCKWLWCWITGCETSRLWMASLCKAQPQLLGGSLNTIMWVSVCWGQETPTLGSKPSREETGMLLAQIPSVPPGSSQPLCSCCASCLQGDGTSSVVSLRVSMAQSWAWEPFCVRQCR